MKKKRLILILTAVFVLVFVAVSGVWIKDKIRKAESIQKMIANPQRIDPEKLLNEIDSSFRKMPKSEKKKILQDPVAAEKLVADATYNELNKSFKLLFMLPPSVREKVIRQSADDLRRKALGDPEKLAEFYDSPAGSGALRGASRFFLFELSGSQKAESAPLTEAMYEIVRDQSKKKVKR